MADIDDADAFFRQLRHNAEEMVYLVLRQRAGRLIQHKDFCVIGYGFADFNHLSLGDRQVADGLTRINVNLQPVENFLGFSIHSLAVHDSQLIRRETSQPYILHNIAAQNLVEFLVHHRNAVLQRVFRAGKCNRFAVHGDRSAVSGIDAEQTFHQCGLSGAVFPHQGVHRAGPQLQFRVIQRFYAGELLLNVQHLQQVLIFGHILSPPFFCNNMNTAPEACSQVVPARMWEQDVPALYSQYICRSKDSGSRSRRNRILNCLLRSSRDQNRGTEREDVLQLSLIQPGCQQ